MAYKQSFKSPILQTVADNFKNKGEKVKGTNRNYGMGLEEGNIVDGEYSEKDTTTGGVSTRVRKMGDHYYMTFADKGSKVLYENKGSDIVGPTDRRGDRDLKKGQMNPGRLLQHERAMAVQEYLESEGNFGTTRQQGMDDQKLLDYFNSKDSYSTARQDVYMKATASFQEEMARRKNELMNK